MSFDYIIVGSGAAGSVMASRLTEDPSINVLVLEAGGSDLHPINLVPKGFYFTMTNPRYVKTFETEPFGDGVVDPWTRGRVLGGSTTVNGMVWNRGWAEDYDALEAAGNPGWNWQSFLAAFKSIENHQLGLSDYRGEGGPVGISVANPPEQVSEAFVQAAAGAGLTRVEDLNASDDERVGYVASNIHNGLRVSASRAFLRPAMKRDNLTVLTHAEVSQVLFEGKRAVGVRVRRKGKTEDYRARREVLLAGGALDTPLLLERSGVGNPEILRAAGVRPIAESPNVGERLLEHRGNSFQWKAQGAPGYNAQVSTMVKQGLTGAKFLIERNGFMSWGGYNVLFFFKSDPSAERPDTQGFFTPVSIAGESLTSAKVRVDNEPGMMLLVYPLRPTSRGSIHITGAHPDNKARIVPNFLDTEHDRRVIAGASHRAREIMASSPVSEFLREETLPGASVTTDEQFVENAINRGGSGYHTLGTCAMGPNDDDVVDARLRVRGTEGLRVIDASVFPAMPSGNNNAPTQALAWIAADLILDDR